jgi:hypothetical protein
VNKPLQFFERKQLEIHKQSNILRTAVTTSTKALLASFEFLYLIAKNKKPHTFGETLLLPAAMKMCKIMHGEKYGEALKTIPLSDNTVMRHTESMSEDIKEHLLTRIKCSPKFAFSNRQINRCCRISSTTCICQILFQRKHPGRVHVLSAAFREMFRE